MLLQILVLAYNLENFLRAAPFTAMMGDGRATSRSPDKRVMARECRNAPSQYGIITAPTIRLPIQPHNTRESPPNLPVSPGIVTGNQSWYNSPRLGGVSWERRVEG